jgi:ParB family chromosome partitioning protein
MSQRRALGKGLDAIFANLGTEVQNPKTGTSVHEIELSKITPNPFQPRLEFDATELQELATSIATNGLIQPIFVRKHGGAYQIVSGERRFRAFQSLKFERIPALVRDQVSDRDMRELALVENIQRVQLNALEEAQAYEQLANEVGLTHEEIAGRVGKSRTTVTNTLRLLKLEPEVREWLREGKLTAGHGRALLQFNGATQVKQAKAILGAGLNVRQAEGARGPKPARVMDPNTRAFVEEFQSLAGMKATVKGTAVRGVLEVHYDNRDALNNLIETLRRGRQD